MRKGAGTITLGAYLLNPDTWLIWGDRLLKALIIVILAHLTLRLGSRLVERVFARGPGHILPVDDRRRKTLAPLLRSVLRYVIDIVATLSILEVFLPPASLQPILASAGIVGVAIGFGAQSLVKDIISGFFILYEDQFAVGDYIKTGSYAGVVSDLGLRVTRLRDFTGEVHVVPNGKIEAVTNLSRGRMQALVEVGVSYEESLQRVTETLQRVARDVAAEYRDAILEGPEVLGIVSFGASEIVIRMIAQTKPMDQWRVERALRASIIEAFAREGIEIPYPHQVFLQGRGGSSARDVAPPDGAGPQGGAGA